MHLFYTPNLSTSASDYVLSEEESKHCSKVLRLRAGDEVVLIDGIGGWYTGNIVDPHPKRTVVKIAQVKQEYQKRNHYLHIAMAPTKHIDRMEWFLEKATELGIDEITPLICEHSIRREVKTERLAKRITAAMKQSLKAYHPILNEAVGFQDFIENTQVEQKYITHCEESAKVYLSDHLHVKSPCLILIGPEGDFSTKEIEMALANGYQAASLGEARLRTETAALAACFEVNLLNRDPL